MVRRRHSRGFVCTATVLLVAALGVSACRSDEPAEETAAPPPEPLVRREAGLDVLLITVDTLRADALGAYGGQGAQTPWVDRLAAAGVRFSGAHAHNVLTLPSHANILSGLYPQDHGVRDNAGFRFPAELPTLASILRDNGYRTGAFISAFPLDSRFGLARGFDVYEDSFVDATTRPAFLEQERAGTETVALAREWLAVADERPWFCWVHLYEPHFPYAPPEALLERFRDRPYYGDVAAADAALAPLLEPILAAANTLVVLTSDHGEALGEHGEATHGIFAYESVLEVPLILYQPRLFEPRVVEAAARHVDLLPTILDALSLPEPAGLRGRSLLPVAVGQADEEPPITYFEALSGQLNQGWAPIFGVLQGDTKYIDLPIPELYDLLADPREERSLAAAEPRRRAELHALLQPLRALDPGSTALPESAEIRQRLEALGYLGGGAAAKESYTEQDDPKRLIALEDVLREVIGRYLDGDLEGALRRCRELNRRRPGMRSVLLHLAHLEREAGHLDAAIEALKEAVALHPAEPTALMLLATYLTQAGREAEAVALTEPYARLAAPDIEVLLARGLALARLQRPHEALAVLQGARAIDPDNALVPVYLGTIELLDGRREEAREAYEEALEINPGIARAHTALAIMATEDGRIDESLAHWRRAVDADPQEHAKLLAVGTRLWRGGRQTAARPLLEMFVASAPRAAYRREIESTRELLADAESQPATGDHGRAPRAAAPALDNLERVWFNFASK